MSRQTIPIPRMTAVVARRDNCSFLDLSSEIRNLIYAELFEVGSPIVFHYTEYESRIWDLAEVGDDESDLNTLEYMKRSSLKAILPEAAAANMAGGTTLLRACRQLYWEAASVLYSNNTFLFSKSNASHARLFGQLPMAVRFSNDLGFGLQFLRRIDIDVCHVCDSLCIQYNHCGPELRLDFAPLAKLMWSTVTAKCEFRFVESQARDLVPIGQMPFQLSMFEVDLDMLNYFVQLLRKDENKVKLFTPQIISMPTYISGLRLGDDDALCRVKLQYQCSDGPRKIDFALDYGNDWKTIYKQAPYTPSLYGIPESLRWKIYGMVLCPPEGVVFDLNTGKRTGIDTSLMYVKQKDEDSPKTIKEMFWTENKFYFRLKSHKPLLPSVQIYREGVRDNWQVLWGQRHQLGWTGSTRLQLTFAIKDNLTLADVRIGVKDLIRLTSALSGGTLLIDILRTQRRGNGEILERNTISLYTLRAQVLKRLAQCAQSHIESLQSTDFEIFIKGNGKVVNVEWADGSLRAPENVEHKPVSATGSGQPKHQSERLSSAKVSKVLCPASSTTREYIKNRNFSGPQFAQKETNAQIVARCGVDRSIPKAETKGRDGALYRWLRFLRRATAIRSNSQNDMSDLSALSKWYFE